MTACNCLTSLLPSVCPRCKNDNPPCVTSVNGERGDVTVVGGEGDPSAAWPVGSVFISVVDTDPATLLGFGTWSAFGAGRVLVGLDSGDAAFDALEETGGAKTVASAGNNAGGAVSAHSGTAVADHASHTHTYTDVIAHTHTIPVGATDDTAAPFDRADAGSNTAGANATTTTGSTGVATGTTAGPSATLTHSVTQPSNHTFTQPTFTGSATSVVQPYVTVRFWKRVS